MHQKDSGDYKLKHSTINPSQRLLFGRIIYHIVNELYTERMKCIQDWKKKVLLHTGIKKFCKLVLKILAYENIINSRNSVCRN
ncbi:hypothetical protein SAMN05443633_101316 [Chryseobacterium arachidis]|uniref:Uncharacterized protein n=1 Tax=Chryseobacterium arachidis TaxID=1416778 RepID=A0A1M4TSR8_9FLAO|nr:hypothetical protein [Chryseobacterium arachidis]SHE47502.1 hypothetical protein SAMN05443633_101316 [Chryseobacterium arachidis]